MADEFKLPINTNGKLRGEGRSSNQLHENVDPFIFSNPPLPRVGEELKEKGSPGIPPTQYL